MTSNNAGAMTPQSSHSLPASARTSRISGGAANGTGSNASSGGRGSISGRSGSALNDDYAGNAAGLSAKVPSETSSVSADYNDVSPAHARLHPSAAGHADPDQSGLGNSIFYDEGHELYGAALSGTPDPAMTQRAIDQVQAKIERTKELIREEQTSRDDNVNEYLKLSSNADRLQQGRIKQLFEKKNQKSAQSIQHLQKKLDDYQRKLQDLQEHGIRPKQSHKLGQGLKNVRDGLSGMTGSVMSKPKEFAHKLRHKFGSADNLSTISKDSDSDPHAGGHGGHANQSSSATSATNSSKKAPNRNHHGSASLPRENSGGGFSETGVHTSSHDGSQKGKRSSLGASARRKCISDDGRRSEHSESVATSNSEEQMRPQGGAPHMHPHTMHEIAESHSSPQKVSGASAHAQIAETFSEWKALMTELNLHKEEVDHLREEMEEQRQSFKHGLDALSEQLREERDRSERLEEQMNDMTELHQHEIENIKSGVNDMEEKVQYQSEERLLDIKEHLQSLETKVTSIEHQQTQQQYLNIEGLDSTDARAVMMKLLTAVITFIHVMLFVVGNVMNLARPFLRTTSRAVVTLTVLVAAIYAKYQQEAIVGLYNRLRHSPTATSEAPPPPPVT